MLDNGNDNDIKLLYYRKLNLLHNCDGKITLIRIKGGKTGKSDPFLSC